MTLAWRRTPRQRYVAAAPFRGRRTGRKTDTSSKRASPAAAGSHSGIAASGSGRRSPGTRPRPVPARRAAAAASSASRRAAAAAGSAPGSSGRTSALAVRPRNGRSSRASSPWPMTTTANRRASDRSRPAERRAPGVAPPAGDEVGVDAGGKRAGLVEQRRGVAPGAAGVGRFGGAGDDVDRVQRRLGAREREPDARVPGIVGIAFAQRDLTRCGDPPLVGERRAARLLRHEPQARPGRMREPRGACSCVPCGEPGRRRQLAEVGVGRQCRVGAHRDGPVAFRGRRAWVSARCRATSRSARRRTAPARAARSSTDSSGTRRRWRR